MKTFSDILFIFSNGLLVPVVLALFCLLVRAALLAAGFYREFRMQKRIAAAFRQAVCDDSPEAQIRLEQAMEAAADHPAARCYRAMAARKGDVAYGERMLADFQVEAQKALSVNRMLIKLGPMLGLMGTLIPMGPALTGLASGDMAAMAYNMQVAFATTVTGLAVAAVGLASLPVRQRFYARSLNDLEYLHRKMSTR